MTDDQLKSVLSALDQIGQNLSPSFFELYLAPLAATFCGAVLAYWFSRWQKGDEDKKRICSNHAKDLALEIASLDAACGHYWSASRSDISDGDEQSRATAIKVKFAHVDRLVRAFQNQIPSNGTTHELQQALNKFCEVGYEVATGDDFEASDRSSDHSKISQISDLSSTARVLLTEYF